MPAPRVSVRCFGGVALERDGAAVTGRATQRRRLALLVLLAASPRRPVSRDKLLAYLWPESDAEAARHLLSGGVYELRRAIGEDAIVSRGDDLWLDPSVVRSDVADFEAALESDDPGSAVSLYVGPFADGFHIGAAPGFERWLEETRADYRRSFRQALEAWAQQRLQAGDPAGAARAWLRSAAEDPADARVLIEAMRALDAAGNRGAALRQAAVYEAFVRAEFGTEPVAEVVALAESMRREPSAPSPVQDIAVKAPQNAAPATLAATGQMPRRRPRALWLAGIAALALIAFAARRLAPNGAAMAKEPAAAVGARVVVLPFAVAGAHADAELGDGIADLLSASLDGTGALRAVRPDAVLAWVARRGGPDSADASEVAVRFGAGLYVTGSIREVSGRLRAHAVLHQQGQSDPLASATAEAAVDRPFDIVDELATQLLAAASTKPAERMSRAAARTTQSLPALKAYLAGERERRAGRFAAAADSFARAVEADSTFALAHYRLSMATLAADLPFSRTAAADERALRYSARLSEHDRVLVRAYAAFRRGDADGAEQAYLSLVASYPDDTEAWRQLGETRFHYNPTRGRPIAEAREAFERVLADEPDEWDTLWHLAQLAASDGRRADARQLLDRLLALRPDTTQSFHLRLLRAVADSDRAAEAALSPQLRRADELQLHQLIWRSAVYVGDPVAAQRFAQVLTVASRPSFVRWVGYQNLAVLRMARGQWHAAAADMAAAGNVLQWRRHDAVLYRAYYAVHSLPPRPRAELHALRDSITALDSEETLHTRLMLIGLLDAALGDTSGALARAGQLDSIRARPLSGVFRALDTLQAPGRYPGRIRAELAVRATTIRAQVARARGDPQAALREIETSGLFQWFGLAVTNMELSQTLERFARAEALREAGRDREAVGWYASFGEYSTFDLPFLAPSHLRRGEIYERLGDKARARTHYARVVELWSECDPELVPLREQARRKVVELALAP